MSQSEKLPVDNSGKLDLRASALGAFHDWPKPEILALTKQEQEAYKIRFNAMKLYCEGVPVKDITTATGLRRQMIYHYLNRCMALAPDGIVWGCRALLPYLHTKAYSRELQPSAKLPEAQGGHAGSLSWLFNRYPGLEDKFEKEIFPEKASGRANEYRASVQTLHKVFLKLLEEYNVPTDGWPFNTKYCGIRTIAKYVMDKRDQYRNRVIYREGESEAKAHLAVGKGHRPVLIYTEPFDAVEIDAYNFDCHSSIKIQTPAGTYITVKIARIWVVAMCDCASEAVLAYKCVFRSEIAATDVIDVMRYSIIGTPNPNPVIKGLVYPEGSGLPCEVIDGCKGALFTTVKFDGALAHLSEKVTVQARKELGFFWTVGPPGHFERRPFVEHLFSLFSNNVFCRLASTTGHGPKNGRAPNSEDAAVKLPILADHLLHLLGVEIAQHNARVSEGLYFISPLEFIRQKLSKDNTHFVPRTLPVSGIEGDTILQIKKVVTVRGSRSKGRRPYIQFLRAHYTSSYLSDAWGLIGKKVILHIDENDLRAVSAFSIDGSPFGHLVAVGKWADTKHDLRTRKAILSKLADRTLQVSTEQDPVLVYLEALTKVTHENPIPVSSGAATEARRVAGEGGVPLKLHEENTDASLSKLGKELEYSDSLIIGSRIPDLNELLKKKRLRS